MYFAVLSMFFIYLFIVVYRRLTYWKRRGLSGPNPIQSSLSFVKIMHINDQIMYRKYGKLFGSYDLFKLNLVVNDPKLIQDILVKHFHTFPFRRDVYLGHRLIDKCIFMIQDSNDWRRIRSIVSPAFAANKLHAMIGSIEALAHNCSQHLFKYVKESKSFDLKPFLSGYTMDVLTASAFGIKTDSISNPNHPIISNARKINSVNASLSLIISFFAPSFARYLDLKPFDSESTEFFVSLGELIIKERSDRSANNSHINHKTDNQMNLMNRKDFIQLMIDSFNNNECDLSLDKKDQNSFGSKNRKNIRLTMDEIKSQAIIFFLAGFETITGTLLHTLYYLSANPECQQKLYAELNTLSNDISHESLLRLKYLNAVISETLRIAPPVSRIERTAIEDYKFENYNVVIPAGTTVTMFPYSIQHDPENFEYPEKFLPERFLPDSDYRHNKNAFIPFGGGPRNCLAVKFAETAVGVLIAKLISEYCFRLTTNSKLDYYSGNSFLCPKSLELSAEKR